MRHVSMIPNTTKRPLFILIATGSLALLATLVHYPSAQSAPNLEKLKEKRAQLKKEIGALTGDKRDLVCEVDDDCDTIPLGAKACGGPRSFIIISKKSEKASAVQRKATEFTSLDKQINEIEQIASTCEILMPPEVHCVKKLCVTKDKEPSVE